MVDESVVIIGPPPKIVTKKKPTPLPYVILSEVESTPVEWLWYPYIPKAALSMIVGDGGYGKSWMTCAIAADLSQGRALPGQEALPPQRVLIISAEDGATQIIKPKLEALDADMKMIAVFDESFNLTPETVSQIKAAVEQFDVTVIFLDPMVAYLGSGMDMHKANDTRAILGQLSNMAKETNTAIVGVHHVKKAMSAIAQHKSLGSVDFVNGTRSTLLVDISKSGQYYMAHVKSNWSKKGPSLAYSMTGDRFAWQGEYSGSADGGPEISKTPRNKARSFLLAILRDGPVRATEVTKLADQEGIPERTLVRAKKDTVHAFQKDRAWYWELAPGVEPLPEPVGTTPVAALHSLASLAPVLTVRTTELPKPTEGSARPDEANLALLGTGMEKLIADAKAKLEASSGSTH